MSGPDCVPVLVLKNCESELLYILAVLFSICLEESCFPDCWKVSHQWSLYIRMLGKDLQLKTTTLVVVSLLPVISKAFEKLANNRIFDHLGFRPSRSTADLLTVASDRIARALLELWHFVVTVTLMLLM